MIFETALRQSSPRRGPSGVIRRAVLLTALSGQLAIAGSPALSLPGRAPAAADAAAQENQEARPLEPGERELSGGQRHAYQLRLSAGQFLEVAVEQKGIDVVIKLFGPDGRQLEEFDSETTARGRETVSAAADAGGDYRLDVQAKQKNAAAGRYEIHVVELRAATERDRALDEGRRLYLKCRELYYASKYGEAESLGARMLEIRERLLGPDHPDVAQALQAIAIFAASGRGDYVKAELLHLRALAIYERALGPEHPGVAESLNLLALFYSGTGEYAKAEPLHRRALAIKEKALGPEHLGVASSANNLAILCRLKGDYGQAESLYQRALAINEKALGPEHLDVAMTLNNLANLYHEKGDYAKGEPLGQRAVAIREKDLGPEHPLTASALNTLANFYFVRGEDKQAESLYQRALGIWEKTLGPVHPRTASALSNLAGIHHDRREYAKAEPLQQRALAIREKTLGPEHPDIAESLHELAGIHLIRGDYARAEPLYQRALAILEKALGPKHPYVAKPLDGLAALYATTGDVDRAIVCQSRANAVAEYNLASNLAAGSERQKLAYIALFLNQTNDTISLHARSAPNDPRALNLALTTLLQRKGRGLDAMTDTIATLRRRAGPRDRELFDRLSNLRSQLAVATLRGSGPTDLASYRLRLKQLREEMEKAEAEVSAHSAEFRLQTEPVTLEAVRSAIPGEAALVEFALYAPSQAETQTKGPLRYIAYVLASEGAPRWIDLGEAGPIDDAADDLRRALSNPKRADVKRLARAMDDLVMRPIRPLLGEKRRVLISPDGALNLIPFAALVDERNHYLVMRYEFSYLTSGRDLPRLRLRRPGREGAVVMADPDFGRTIWARRGFSLSSESPAAENAQPEHSSFRLYFRSLPGTAAEAREVRAIFPQAALLTRKQATEAALKRVRGPEILHVATHGFFLEDLEAGLAGTRGLGLPGVEVSRMISNLSNARFEIPLLRSGLALAGANERRSGDDDGVLTALEAAGLDLWGTKLVALSACDTGVGEVRNGDGVYGLRRALTLAGAESQVMSLWQVSDLGARDLMAGYYRGLRRGDGRSAALRQTQLRLLRSKHRRHPFYWASFIQSGEWANLQGQR